MKRESEECGVTKLENFYEKKNCVSVCVYINIYIIYIFKKIYDRKKKERERDFYNLNPSAPGIEFFFKIIEYA